MFDMMTGLMRDTIMASPNPELAGTTFAMVAMFMVVGAYFMAAVVVMGTVDGLKNEKKEEV